MKCIHLILLITFFCSIPSKAIYILSNNFGLKNYTLAKTKVDISVKNNKRESCGSFIVRISNESYKVFVKIKNIPYLYTNVSEIIFLSGNRTRRENISNRPWNVVEGFVRENSNKSGVSGYIQHGMFYGTITLNDKIYYVEDVNRYATLVQAESIKEGFNAIIYDEDAVHSKNRKDTLQRKIRRALHKENLSEAASRMIYKKFIEDKHICPLLVVLDNSFLKKVHKNDVMAAVAQIMLSINEVNSVFRSTDFDGDGKPDNIGFVIKYLVIIENEESPFNYMPYYSYSPVSPRFYLAHFAQYLILREVCLGVAFTAQPFQENVLGVSYSAVSENDISNDIVGGICQRPFTSYMLSLNAVAVSYVATRGNQLPQSTLDTCLTHEFGHAFGCRHDLKSDPGYSAEYIMSSHTLPGTTFKNFQFSPMSKKHLVMTVPRKGQCMLKASEPFCGNGIKEHGEECDCGAKYLCQKSDPCCIPSGVYGACQINRAFGYECHPSQGFCCSSNCRFENLEKAGLNCRLMNQTCPCDDGYCTCGLGGSCLANECQSQECARIDAEECECPLPNIQDSCNTCCLANPRGPCLSSRNLTKWKLDLGLITIKQLKTFKGLDILQNATEFEIFCHGKDCVTLDFKKFNLGDYCLKNGKVGRCSLIGCSFRGSITYGVDNESRNIGMKMSYTLIISKSSIIFYSVYLISIKCLL